MILSVDGVSKSFGSLKAVNNVSFEIKKGRICGFLGPNGAGKTTLIRMIMDIYTPDQGRVTLAPDLTDHDRKNQIGYLPEVRGLYTKAKVRETLLYFARLKGLSKQKSVEHTDFFLERLHMQDVANQKIEKLSKGNQQKIQVIAAMVAKPPLLILDEPFSGLDPVNIKMVSDLITELCAEGVSIVLSTHQMNQAETFCHDILLFNKGTLILSGEMGAVIEQFSGNVLMLETSDEIPPSPLYRLIGREGKVSRIELAEDITVQALLHWLVWSGVDTHSLQPYRVPLSDIFIQEVSRHETR
ncbi:ABC transporter ATP-binding protein [Acanthopleuribacter pedis]|uniref:ATP-binding cassette domain-containing protein n=1 Tax=Acanthopleuribacter pedis TaxID=442870 RepID=A0A8J7QQT7_9BACT|nr:ATP-binding cassette domain-containing protein [Acanthopleuribacter pedis]MBO1322778.1 ATP-binding cassette domain-containing protein [Acanthopleuribacter pedis]